ncbi:MAG: sulfite exporter TauE/SafE family protein [Lactobacillus sp.]
MFGKLLVLCSLGLVTGSITSLIGASGVSVVVPALTLFFALSSHVAIGTSLLVDVITSIVVAIGYFRAGNVRLTASLWLTVGLICGSLLGAQAGIIPDNVLNSVFAVVLLVSGIATLRRGGQQVKVKSAHLSKAGQTAALLGLGLVIGIISGLVGAGGGVMMLVAIIFALHYPMHEAVGTSTVIMAITALTSLLGYARQGNVAWDWGLVIAIGAVIAGFFGAKLANKIDEVKLNKVVAWLFIILSIFMIALRRSAQ